MIMSERFNSTSASALTGAWPPINRSGSVASGPYGLPTVLKFYTRAEAFAQARNLVYGALDRPKIYKRDGMWFVEYLARLIAIN